MLRRGQTLRRQTLVFFYQAHDRPAHRLRHHQHKSQLPPLAYHPVFRLSYGARRAGRRVARLRQAMRAWNFPVRCGSTTCSARKRQRCKWMLMKQLQRLNHSTWSVPGKALDLKNRCILSTLAKTPQSLPRNGSVGVLYQCFTCSYTYCRSLRIILELYYPVYR